MSTEGYPDDCVVTTDEAWEGVPLGEACLVIGTLGAISYGGQPLLLITFADWSQLPVRVDDPTVVDKAWTRKPVRIRCVRDEDGLIGRVIWPGYSGGVPVPLTTVSAGVSGNLT